MSLLDSLVSYWKLEEASGTRSDSHSTNHLADINTVTSNPGKLGTAGQFTAASLEYLSVADNAALSTGDIDFTIAAWVYLDSKTTQRPIAGKWASGEYEYLLAYHQSNDRFNLFASPDGSAVAGVAANNLGSPALATWYYVVGSHSATDNALYIWVNNGLPNATAHTAGVRDGAQAFEVGRNADGTYMDGRIDGLGFWKRVLTPEDRILLYAGGAGFEYPFGSLLIPNLRTPRVLRQRF